jgi:hypothetical protein
MCSKPARQGELRQPADSAAQLTQPSLDRSSAGVLCRLNIVHAGAEARRGLRLHSIPAGLQPMVSWKEQLLLNRRFSLLLNVNLTGASMQARVHVQFSMWSLTPLHIEATCEPQHGHKLVASRGGPRQAGALDDEYS